MSTPNVFIGIAVGARRRISLCAASPQGQVVWSEACRIEDLSGALDRVARRTATRNWAIGISAPRTFIEDPRIWTWRSTGWAQATGSTRGRHCEVIIRALGLGSPPWTPLAGEAPPWMRAGVELHRSAARLADEARIHEVFPGASRRQFARHPEIRVPYCRMFRKRRGLDLQEQREDDAFTAAWTAAAFESGQGCAVGGGDGLGAIILPGRIPADCPAGLLIYPALRNSESQEADRQAAYG